MPNEMSETELPDMGSPIDFDRMNRSVPPRQPERPDFTREAISQEFLGFVDRGIGLRNVILTLSARVAELEHENAELRKESV